MSIWNDSGSGWTWFLWLGVWLLLLSSFGNLGYSYRTHRRYRDLTPQNNANDILNDRYAKGEIDRNAYLQMKRDIAVGVSNKGPSDAQFTQHSPA
jgi:uncharacterized membrane protein